MVDQQAWQSSKKSREEERKEERKKKQGPEWNLESGVCNVITS
jgi:hypothetical protein